MDQSEIDALTKAGMPHVDAPVRTLGQLPPPGHPQEDQPSEGRVISEIDAVTEVTERETNKVMDQLDLISQLVTRQQQLVTEVMKQSGAQDPAVQQAIYQIMAAGKEIQDKVFEAMDLMQFQDITRQKLERIVYHLRQIHDYIVELLGTGLKNDESRASISRTIASTGTTPDERKAHADSVVEEYLRSQKKD